MILRKNVLTVALMAAAVFSTVQCKKDGVNSDGKSQAENIDKGEDFSSLEKAREGMQYSIFVFPDGKKDSAMKAFQAQFDTLQQYNILAINRLDKKHISNADTLVVPNKFEQDFRAYSPFPFKMEILRDVPKFVVFSYPVQAFAVYEKGDLKKWGPTSLGRKDKPTTAGLHFTNWKKELHQSTVKDEWMLPYNFNIENEEGIGWHEYDLPGYPASHSCLRLLHNDAVWMYDFAEQWILDKDGNTPIAKGTPVLVYGDYNWDGPKIWKQLAKDPKITNISEQDLAAQIQPYKAEILKEQENRATVIKTTPESEIEGKMPTK
ncbi:L,D-transpeptidase [Cruoricaptor ignavus]|uniref:L,D-transpeptidase n=1 Tax=Cruoricaptor ignavus TaxID=1118202 RepID=UPI00370DC568